MSDIAPELGPLFMNYAANVAADLTRRGAGFLARALRKTDTISADIRRPLNLSLQAELASKGVGNLTAERVARWLLDEADIAHLLDLWETQDAVPKYANHFREEVRAHLKLEARVQEDIDIVTDVLVAVLSTAGATQLARRSKRAARGTPAPAASGRTTSASAIFMYGHQASRLSQFTKTGEYGLAQISNFTSRYLANVRDSLQGLRLQHLGPRKAEVSIDSLFVPPRFQELDNRSVGMSTTELLLANKRTVILGPAGIGKSTAVRHAALSIAKLNNDQVVPLLIELRKTTSTAMGPGRLFLDVFRDEIKESMQEEPPDGWLEFVLLSGRAIVFFDGFDEVLVAGRRSEIRDAIRSFAQLYPSSSIVVTSRITGYEIAPLPDATFDHANIRPLDNDQVSRYVKLWFAFSAQGNANHTDLTVASFLEESAKYAAEIRVNPLMLSLLCSVYYTRGDIPRSLSELYERCASLLYHQWNVMRGIEDHGAWNPDVRSAIYYIADLVLSRTDYLANGIPESDLKTLLARYWVKEQDLDWTAAAELAQDIIDVWAGRAWLVTAVASDENNHPKFGFVHQSFLEYFAAVHAVRAIDTAGELFVSLRTRLIYMNGWSVAQLAVSTFDARRESGGSLFIDALLQDSARAPASEQLSLLRFAIAMARMVRIEPKSRLLLFQQTLTLIGNSIVLPVGNQTLGEVHDISRDTHNDWVNLITEDLEDTPDDMNDFRVAYSQLSLSTLETEPLALDLVDVFGPDTRFDIQLSEALTKLSAADREPDRDVLASVLFVSLASNKGVLIEEMKSALIDRIGKVRSELSWYGQLAALTIGALDKADCLGAMPWHVLMLRESLFLSLEHDLMTPAWLRGDIGKLGAEGDSLAVIGAIGESIADQCQDGIEGLSVIQIENAKDGLALLQPENDQFAAGWASWEGAEIVGYTAVLRVCGECWGTAAISALMENLPVPSTGSKLDFETSAGTIQISIPSHVSARTQTLLALIASGEAKLVVDRYRV